MVTKKELRCFSVTECIGIAKEKETSVSSYFYRMQIPKVVQLQYILTVKEILLGIFPVLTAKINQYVTILSSEGKPDGGASKQLIVNDHSK